MPFWNSKDKAPVAVDSALLDEFARALPGDPGSPGPVPAWTDKDTQRLLGREHPLFTAFLRDHVRASFGGGLLRFLMPDADPSLTRWNSRGGWHADWPDAAGTVAFASDWMGRLYLLAPRHRLANGEPPVGMVDPAAAELARFDYGFGEFLGIVLARDWATMLERDRFDRWRAGGGAVPNSAQCVEPRAPLFLGGNEDERQVTSLVVAVSFAGQLWQQVRNLPVGAKITGIKIE